MSKIDGVPHPKDVLDHIKEDIDRGYETSIELHTEDGKWEEKEG